MVNKMEGYEVVLHILFRIIRVSKHCECLKLIYVRFRMHLGKYKLLWKLKTVKKIEVKEYLKK